MREELGGVFAAPRRRSSLDNNGRLAGAGRGLDGDLFGMEM
jgi:hypothetical protein